MVIILPTPKGEEELRTGPKRLKVEHFVGRMGGGGPWPREPGSGCPSASSSWAQITDNPSSVATHRARWAMHTASKGPNPLRGCYHHLHFTNGKVDVHGPTENGRHTAWSSAAKVLAPLDLREGRAGLPGSGVRLAGGQRGVLLWLGGGGQEASRRWGAGSGRAVQGHLRGTMWAP